MGTIFCERKRRKIGYSFKYEKFKNGLKRTFNTKEDFSLSTVKKRSIQMFYQISNFDTYHKKKEHFEKILSLNNINENIIFEYLLLLKNNEYNLYQEKLKEYTFSLSNEKYYKLENKKKNKDSKYYIKEFFKNIYEFDKTSFTKRLNFYYYLKEKPRDILITINFSEKENPELYLYFLFYNIFCIFENQIAIYSKNILESTKSFDDKLKEFVSLGSQKIISQFNDFLKTNETLIIYSKFFDSLSFVSDFLKNKMNIINEALEKNNIDFYFLEGILLIIKNEIQYYQTISEKTDNLFVNYYNNNDENIDLLNENFKNIKLIINNENIEIYQKSGSKLGLLYEIENYKIYNNLKKSIENIDNCYNSTNETFIKYYLIDDLKLQNFQENNYVKYTLPFIRKFHKNLSNSKTINSLVNYLFPGYEEGQFLSNDFILSIFENSLNNAKFYPFDTKIYCTTFYHSLNINYQISNKIDSKERRDNLDRTFFKYIIINLSYYIICEFHQVLGHYIREYLNLLTLMDYESPRGETGNYIQNLLFDNKISLNLYELIFILDSNNYNVDYNTFRKNFLNLNDNEKYEPSIYFKNDIYEFFGFEYDMIKEQIRQDVVNNNKYHLFGDLKSDKTNETLKFEINEPCSLNLKDIYIKHKNRTGQEDIIYEKLKNNYELYLKSIK